MRDDAWHDEAYDGDDAPPEADDRADLDARYGAGDPRANAWSGMDLAIGWAVGIAAILVVGLVHGVVSGLGEGGTPMYGAVLPWFAAIYGAPVLTIYGVPVAALAASLLRRVRAESVHLAVFAVLGALGCLLFDLAMTGLGGTGSGGPGGWFVTTVAYGVVAAVAARAVAKRCAIARFDRRRGGALPAGS